MMIAGEVFSRIVEIYEKGGVLPTCAWCGRVRIDDKWVDAPPAALAAIEEHNVLSHSICDGCTPAGAAA